MHGSKNVKFANAQQAKQIYQYKNVKEKLYETYAAMWYNRTCRQRKLSQTIYQSRKTVTTASV